MAAKSFGVCVPITPATGPDWLCALSREMDAEDWERLAVHAMIVFDAGFDRRGPVGYGIQLIR